jgi:hypothetical protein
MKRILKMPKVAPYTKFNPSHTQCECGECDWEIAEMIDAGGATRYPYLCSYCGIAVTVYAKKKEALRVSYRRKHLGSYAVAECEVCGAIGAQEHHWAPWHVFGNVAQNWPVSYLCQSCHSMWHRLMGK